MDLNSLTPEIIYSICMNHPEIDSSNENNGIDEQKLSMILNKFNMSEYKELFLKDRELEKYKLLQSKKKGDNYNKRRKQEIEKILKLLNTALIFKKTQKSRYGTEITVKNIYDQKETLNDPSLSKLIEDRVLELLFEMGIGLNVSNDLLEIYKIVTETQSKNKKFKALDKTDFYEKPNLKQELYRVYRKGLKIKSEVSEDYLKEKISEYNSNLKNIKAPKGAEYENHFVGIMAVNLSYLIRIKEFIFQKQIDDIRMFTLNNNSARFIYDMLCLFGLISEKQQEEHDLIDPKGTNDKPHFIKSIIKQRYKKAEQSDFIRYGYNPDDEINNVWLEINKNT